MTNMQEMGRLAKSAAVRMGALDGKHKDDALVAVARALENNAEAILAANAADMAAAVAQNLSAPLLKRLTFDRHKLEDVIAGIHSLIGLPDPVGRQLSATELEPGLVLRKVSCPIGVIGVIFEARPDALVQISMLCLKSGNAALLKGGSEALNTNRVLADVIIKAGVEAGLPNGWMQLLETREEVGEMLKLDDYIDLIVPRGSNAFVKYIMNNSNIPVMGHADGICHAYVDAQADLDMAVGVVTDAKTQYVSVCNAIETLLVHRAVAEKFLPKLAASLEARHCKIIGDEATCRILPGIQPATEEDWKTEYLDYILSIKVVEDETEAIEHINRYGSGHTDIIITADEAAAETFMRLVDSADVFWNCSSRFADGFRFGLGAEVGIATGKIHARGPVGLEGLTIYKYLLKGNGQIVEDFATGKKHFTHKPLV